ncbi:MAG: hypothetical protein K2J32_09890 [Ruminococcus sp.]|nr:hypothetical protein [Ruminococcus sp.]
MKKHKKLSVILFLMILAVITGTIKYIIEYKPYLSGTYENEDKNAVLVIGDRQQGSSYGTFFVNNEVVKYILYNKGNNFEFYDIVDNYAKMYESIYVPFNSNIFTQKITFTYDGVEYSFKKVGSSPGAL